MNIQTSKKTLWGALAAGIFAVAAFALMAHAATAPTVSCSGAVSGDQITWTATSTGGVAPYTYLWSGSGVASGTTSTAFTVAYPANATYTAMVQVTDASSSVATSSCAATVSAYPTVSTGTLNVSLSVNNAAGGSATPSGFTVNVSGANANPGSFPGNASGTPVVVGASSTYAITVSALPNYSASMTGNCTGPLAAGASDACAVTETYVPSAVTPTTTPPLPRVYKPELTINGDGRFLVHGMIVTSVASGSFQGTVWGITYTVNWSGGLYPEFYLRDGNGGGATNPVTQLQVGDEVGVSGIVSQSNPLVVQANVVRDYSIMALRPGRREGQFESPFYNGKGNGGQNFFGASLPGSIATTTAETSSVESLNARLQQLLTQFHNLQNIFQNRENGNGHTNGRGNGRGGN